MGEGPYHVGSLDGAPIAGIFQKPEEDDLPVSWMTYLAVSDLDAALADTKKHGGKIIRETFEVPGVGRMAVVSDPGGAVLSLMTPSD
jgi:predicted enzyme related to lactoylglutathione lyase